MVWEFCLRTSVWGVQGALGGGGKAVRGFRNVRGVSDLPTKPGPFKIATTTEVFFLARQCPQHLLKSN